MACEIAEAVVRCVFISFAERRIIEDLLDKLVDGLAVVENHHSNVDELGGTFADEANAKKLAIRAREDELEHSGGVSNDVAARVIFVEGAPDAIVNLLFLAGFFGFAGGG